MKETMFYESLKGNIRCHLCNYNCMIKGGKGQSVTLGKTMKSNFTRNFFSNHLEYVSLLKLIMVRIVLLD